MNTRFLAIGALTVAGVVTFSVAIAQPRLFAAGGRAEVTTRLIAKANDAQAPAFSDGVVSEDERVEAAEKTAECLRAAGVPVEMTPDRGAGHFRYGGGSYEQQQRANAIYDDCYARFQREIDMVFALQQPALPPATRSAAEHSLVTCLQSEALELSDAATKDVWWEFRITNPVEFGRCADATIAEFGGMP